MDGMIFLINLEKINIRYKRTGYNINVMRQTACLVLTQSRLKTVLPSLIASRRVGPQTQWRLPPKNFQSSCLGLDALFLIGPTWIQLLDFRSSSVSVLVLLLSIHLVSSQCWILIYIFAVLIHRWAINPSCRPNNLYVYEPQQNPWRGLLQRKTGLSPQTPVSFTDRSNVVLLLWLILIVNVRPLSVCLWHFVHFI